MDSDYIATFPDRYITSNEFLIEPDSRGEYDKIELVRWLNTQLSNDEMLTSQYQYIPIKEDGNDFFYALSDGVIIAHIIKKFYPNFNFHIRYAKPGLINKNTNNKEVLRVARIISSKQVTLGEANLSTPERTTVSLILGFIWMLLDKFQEKKVRELAQETTGSIEEFMLSWVNTILEEDGVDLKINNFGDDIKDSVAYLHLLHHFNPECSLDALNNNNLLLRAASVLDNADLLNARAFVDAKQIVNGDSVRNYRFVNNLYQIINAPKEESEEIKVEDAYEETKPIDEPEVIEEVPEKVEETKLDKMISIEQTKEELIKKDKEKLAEDIKQKAIEEEENLRRMNEENEENKLLLEEMNDLIITAKVKDAQTEKNIRDAKLKDIEKQKMEEEQEKELRVLQEIVEKKRREAESIKQHEHLNNDELVTVKTEIHQENIAIKGKLNNNKILTQEEQIEYEEKKKELDKETRRLLEIQERKQERVDQAKLNTDKLNVKLDEIMQINDQITQEKQRKNLLKKEKARAERKKAQAQKVVTQAETKVISKERERNEVKADTALEKHEKEADKLMDMENENIRIDDDLFKENEKLAEQEEQHKAALEMLQNRELQRVNSLKKKEDSEKRKLEKNVKENKKRRKTKEEYNARIEALESQKQRYEQKMKSIEDTQREEKRRIRHLKKKQQQAEELLEYGIKVDDVVEANVVEKKHERRHSRERRHSKERKHSGNDSSNEISEKKGSDGDELDEAEKRALERQKRREQREKERASRRRTETSSSKETTTTEETPEERRKEENKEIKKEKNLEKKELLDFHDIQLNNMLSI
ncbi:hypothetical protein QTN25_003845 [Entamoeba marina]